MQEALAEELAIIHMMIMSTSTMNGYSSTRCRPVMFCIRNIQSTRRSIMLRTRQVLAPSCDHQESFFQVQIKLLLKRVVSFASKLQSS